MSTKEDFPLDFWQRDGLTSINVLFEMLNETRMPIEIIKGYSQILLGSELSEEKRVDIEMILKNSKYLESVMNAVEKYAIKLRDS